MVILGWSSFNLVFLVLRGVTPLNRNRDINYYDGSRGRMDRSYFAHEDFFQRNSRLKRTPQSPNSWAKSSDSQGVSCPTRLRENSLDTQLSDSDRMKEVVHIPCPKRKSSGAKVVASFRGKSTKCKAGTSHRVARDLLQNNPRGSDLNQAVTQNGQWLLLSSQDQMQKPNQGYLSPNDNPVSVAQMGHIRNINLTFPNNLQWMPVSEQSATWSHPKDESRRPQYSKSVLNTPQNAASKLKPNTQVLQNRVHAPVIPRLKETNILEKAGQQFSIAPNSEYYSLGPPRTIQIPQVVEPSPYLKKEPKNPYEGNRFPINSNNMTHDGPHHSGPPNQPTYINAHNPNPLGQFPYPNVQGQMIPSFFQSHGTTANPGVPYNNYLVVYDSTIIPSGTPKTFYNTNEPRNWPWAPGALEVDIPPGYPHQPKLPKTTRSSEAVNIKDLPKTDHKIQGTSNQLNFHKYDSQGPQYPCQNFHNAIPQNDSWRYQGAPYNSLQLNSSSAKEEPQLIYDTPGLTPAIKKTTQANKGVFGKFKKEEGKIKSVKPTKIAAWDAHARAPPASQPAQGGVVQSNVGSIMSNAINLNQQELQSRQQNSQRKNEIVPKMPKSKAVISHRKMSQDMSILNHKVHQDYRNYSGDLSHILDPPVTMDTYFLKNKAHKIPLKIVGSNDVTYVPFRGVPPARNDEAFYDKNLNFLGKIDRPPLVNLKKLKWTKLNRHFNNDRTYKRLNVDYPMGFHSDLLGDFGSAQEPESANHHYRKCLNKRGRNRPRFISR